MKPLIINLLVEEEQANQARARDPVKVLIAISTGVLALVVAGGGTLACQSVRSSVELTRLERQWQALSLHQTSRHVDAYRSLKQWADDLIAINQSRPLCAPQLALIKDSVPDYIQLLGLSLVTTTVAQAPPGPAPDGSDIKARIAQRAPAAAQVVTLQLEGKIISVRPEEDMANFRHNLESASKFSAQIKEAQLRSYVRLAGPAERGGPAVGQFVIECQLKEAAP